MLKSSLHKLLHKLTPAFFTNRNLNLLKQKKPFNIVFLNDKYIYKNIEKGYALLYHEYNFGLKDYIFTNFNYSLDGVSKEVLQEIHSFNWLQNLKIINSQNSSHFLYTLIDTWINNIANNTNDLAYNINILASRLFNWLTSQRIIEVGNESFKNKVLSSLSFQIRFFLKSYKLSNSKDSLLLNKTLFVIGRSLSTPKISTTSLDNILIFLKKYVLADGGIFNFSPSEVLNALEDIIFVYKNLNKCESNYKNEFRIIIDKMIIFIKSLRYKDGGLAVFNGGYEEEANKVSFLLSLGSINAKPFDFLRYSGYLRLKSGSKIDIIVKTNSMVTEKCNSTVYSNSILSNEIIVNGIRVFVNNTTNSFLDEYQLNRAAYSTMLFFEKNNKLVDMPQEITIKDCKLVRASDAKWNTLTLSYKGLEKSHGIEWHKTLSLAKEDSCILGEELISLKEVSPPYLIHKVILKFILHPGITVKGIDKSKHYIYLDINNEEWVFRVTKGMFIQNEIYKGVKDILYPTISINLPLNMKDRVLQWSLIQTAFLDAKIIPIFTKVN